MRASAVVVSSQSPAMASAMPPWFSSALPWPKGQLVDRVAVDHVAGVPGAAAGIAALAGLILRLYLVAVAAAVGSVVDLVRPHVVGRHQQAVGERPPHGYGETVVCAHADRAAPLKAGSATARRTRSRSRRIGDIESPDRKCPWTRCTPAGSPRLARADARHGFPGRRSCPRSSPAARAAPRSSTAQHTSLCDPVVRRSACRLRRGAECVGSGGGQDRVGLDRARCGRAVGER